MVRVLRYPRLCALCCAGAFAAAIARDLSLGGDHPGSKSVLLTLTLILLLSGLCLLSCRFLIDHEGVGVGFLFSVRRTKWADLHALGTLCCNSRRVYLYGLYRTSPDFLHMLNRAPRCGPWGFVVPMSGKLAAGVSACCPHGIDPYTGIRRRREKGMRPIWHHALLYTLSSFATAGVAALSSGALLYRALEQNAFSSSAALTLGSAAFAYFALQLLYRGVISLQTCPHISENGVSAGRALYLSWDEVRFGYVHRMGRVSALYLLSEPQNDMTLKGGPPVRCLSMPDTSTLVLAYLNYCPHASKAVEA